MCERMQNIKETLLCAVEEQLLNLECVDAKELGEVIDMIKDIDEAEYYCAVVKAMHESEDPKKTHHGSGTDHYTWAAKGTGVWESGGGAEEWSHMEDLKDGRSYKARRMYIESKEKHQDKTTQMKELEKYAQELTQDIIEMVEDSTPEERQYLSKKVTALANKITQLNTANG